jgi:hypothetical protein
MPNGAVRSVNNERFVHSLRQLIHGEKITPRPLCGKFRDFDTGEEGIVKEAFGDFRQM